MLASLLPGIRNVRSPLAAGFLWLVALWFLLEPQWDRDAADGAIGSANRLMDTLSLLGQGAVLSFTAYLVGSFSVFLFSGPLLSLIRTSQVPRRRLLDGLSEQGRLSLAQVATDGRQRLEQALALSGFDVDDLLGLTAPGPEASDKRPPVDAGGWWRRWRRRRESKALTPEGPGSTPPRVPEREQENEIAERVLRDLPVVANAQLLGRETDVFSAVDRSQSEVEFRVALVPALAAVAVAGFAAALGDNAWLAVAAFLVGVLGPGGLLLDAARQRRSVNDLILSLMEHGRIKPPSVLRAESAATALADQAPARLVGRQAEETVRVIRRYLDSLDWVPRSSSVDGVLGAHEAARRARESATRLDHLLGQFQPAGWPADRSTAGVLEPLDRALSGWSRLNAGITVEQPQVPEWSDGFPSADELLRLVGDGRERLRTMIDQVRALVHDLANRDAAAGVAADVDAHGRRPAQYSASTADAGERHR